MAKYYCILFDVDNTLLDFDAAERKALADTLVNYGIEPDAETVQTYHTINEETLAMMKDGAVLINTARGGLVDLPAVLKALESGKLSGFGFDVHENEVEFVRKKMPIDQIHDPVFKALLQRDDAIYSPHVAFYTDAAILNMIDVSLDNLKEYETTGKCRNEVNPQGF